MIAANTEEAPKTVLRSTGSSGAPGARIFLEPPGSSGDQQPGFGDDGNALDRSASPGGVFGAPGSVLVPMSVPVAMPMPMPASMLKPRPRPGAGLETGLGLGLAQGQGQGQGLATKPREGTTGLALNVLREGGSRPREEPKLENIVSTVNLECQLDPRKIALQAKNAEFNPKRFAAVIMRIRDPKTTALIFKSGKMVCTGAKSEQDSETAARKYAKTIKKLGFEVKFKEFTIQNIVGSCSVNFAINLEALQLCHQRFCTYDPEIFPGLIYRMEKPKIVLLIFCSGKVVLTGAKKRQELTDAFNKIYDVLCLCRKDTVPVLPT